MLVGVSLATDPPPEEKVEDYTWRREIWTEETEELGEKPWYKNYRYHSIVLGILTAAMVIWWW